MIDSLVPKSCLIHILNENRLKLSDQDNVNEHCKCKGNNVEKVNLCMAYFAFQWRIVWKTRFRLNIIYFL